MAAWLATAALADDAGPAAAESSPENIFLAAWANPGVADEGDSPALAAYPLYPWLQAARLKNALLAQQPDAAARADAFLARAGDAPHGRELRRARLNQLAAASDAQGFLALWRESAADDGLRCLWFDARRATGDAGVAEAVAKTWLDQGKPLPECVDSFNWLKTQPVFTPELIEQRLRARLLDNDAASAKPLLPLLPEPRRKRYETWLKLLADPAAEIAKLAKAPATSLDGEGLADVWLRWARNNASEANTLLPKLVLVQGLSLTDKQVLIRNTALALAWNRDPAALALFRDVPENLLDDRSHEWRIRSALWAGDWNTAFNWLSLLPEGLADDSRWRYWTARALAESGQEEEARSRFESLLTENDVYGLFAAWRSGKGWLPQDRPNPLTPTQRAALDANPAFVRAREAWRLALKPMASLEWREALDTLPPEARPALIRAAAGLGWYDQAIVTASRLGQYGDLTALFPRPYETLVREAASAHGVPAFWIWAVMRRESAFKPDARSSAGAVGLLQMLPGTAAMTAKALGQPAPTAQQLADPRINIPLGTAHLKEVLEKSDGRWQMALAAYNAGFRAANRWRPPEAMEADVWIENIPFNETRAYVQRILFHAGVYQWLMSEKAVRANNWLPPVEPLPAADTVPAIAPAVAP